MISRQKLIEELEPLRKQAWEKYIEYAEPENFYHEGCYDAIMRVIDIIESQPPADQWIPCSERLPDKGGTYLVTQERYRLDDRLYKKPVVVETTFAEFNFMDDVWNRARHLKVIAWMPLPEPYKGVE